MQRIPLLGPALVILLGSTLVLAACNSSSVSDSSQKTSGPATVTQTTARTPTKSSSSQTLPAAWVAKIKALQGQ